MKRCFFRLSFLWTLLAMPLAAGTSLIYVVNIDGNTVDGIDPVTNKVVQRIEGIEVPTAVDSSPDGSRIYITSENGNALIVVDRKSGKTIKKVPLSGHPNLLAATKDGKRILVCIRSIPGGLDVIDATSLERVKTIPTKAGTHDVFLTLDGKYAVAGTGTGPKNFIFVVDLLAERVAWEMNFDLGTLPMAIESGPGGSPRRIFAELERFRGFAVVDFATRKEVGRIKFPAEPSGFSSGFSRGVGQTPPHSPTHGIGIAPDGKTLWVNSVTANAVFVYSLPELKLLGPVSLPLPKVKQSEKVLQKYGDGASPNWLTFTPDSKTVYISDSALNSVSAIDVKTRKEVALIPVGKGPRRMNTLVLP